MLSCDSDNSKKEHSIEKTKHALVIGIDGALVSAVHAADTPNIDSLAAHGAFTWTAYSGGDLNTETQQVTSSGPAWSSILTGVWTNKHGVIDNDFTNPNYSEYPHFFKRIKEAYPNAYLSSIVNWKPINDKIPSYADYEMSGNDEQVAALTIDLLQSQNPFAIFLQFDEVDGAGHTYGYDVNNPDYRSAIAKVDKYIGQITKAISKRPTLDSEDWLTVVTTDHGGKHKGHGGQSPEERTVFMIACGGGVTRGEVNPGPGIVAVPPTVLTHLGIQIDPLWGLEEKAFGFAGKK